MTRIPLGVLLAAFFFLNGSITNAQFPPGPGTGPGLPETVDAIDNARVTTRILYVTAHPDDESSAALTYLARGLHAEVALLALTRGEGGQNALGPEQAPQLGLIRTQELLAATRGYGVKLYFTRARDFGFSKTPEEAERIWGDQVVEDMVAVIREFRPDIVINNFGGVHTGHGHHQAAGLLTPKAVKLAADVNAYPQQLQADGLHAWNGDAEPVRIFDLERGSERPNGYVLPIDQISPLYGKSWREIGMDAFVNHRTQGVSLFLGSPFLRRPIGLIPEDGKAFDPASLAVPLSVWAQSVAGANCSTEKNDQCRLIALGDVDKRLGEARTAVLALDWRTATKKLAEAGLILHEIVPNNAETSRGDGSLTADQLADFVEIESRVDRALLLVTNLDLSAEADRSDLVLGEPVSITVKSRCRPDLDCTLGKITLKHSQHATTYELQETDRSGDPNTDTKFTADVVKTGKPAWPIWAYLPTPPVIAQANQPVTVANYTFEASQPVTYIGSTTTTVVRVPLRVVPAYTIAVEPKQALELLPSQHKPLNILLRIHSYSRKEAEVSAGVKVPEGWSASPPATLKFDGGGDQFAKFTVTPSTQLEAGNYTLSAYAERGGEHFDASLTPLPTMPTLLWEDPAQCQVHAFAITVPKNLRVGYVSAEGEPVPDALRMLGIQVDLLDANALNFGDLSGYSSIVIGVRAYELRPELSAANARLLDYVRQGGTLVVQYERDYAWNANSWAPYPARIGGNAPGAPLPRITDENSPVVFLKPDDRLLNFPNKITQDDFKGWVQERGLYFWSNFDSRYTPLLSMHDPGEKEQDGALEYARYGKGVYIYTAIAFFRQLPEGVPGAYRLFVNLLDASQPH